MQDAFRLPKLSYAYDALEPYIDARTVEIHYTKHHQTYVNGLNTALKETEHLQRNFSDLLQNLSSLPENLQTAVRNHGGGHANHTLFWHILDKASEETSVPTGELRQLIDSRWGSFEKFKELLKEKALGLFGSGWVWLAHDPKIAKTCHDCLNVLTLPNQDSPYLQGLLPIMGIDLWEHAYYLKYQNRRADYVDNIFKVINWETVSRIFADTRHFHD